MCREIGFLFQRSSICTVLLILLDLWCNACFTYLCFLFVFPNCLLCQNNYLFFILCHLLLPNVAVK